MKYKQIQGQRCGVCDCGRVITRPLTMKRIENPVFIHNANIDKEKCFHCLEIKCRCEEFQ